MLDQEENYQGDYCQNVFISKIFIEKFVQNFKCYIYFKINLNPFR
jgi:hypothetical protein